MSEVSLIEGQPSSDGEPVFDAPWQARAFSITVSLNESGLFDWSEWVDAFSASIKQFEKTGSIESSDDYYRLWLDTLEVFSNELMANR